MTGTRHAYERALERYDVSLSVDDFRNLTAACIDGRAVKMAIDDRGNSVHIYTHVGTRFVILFGADRKIISFMPPDYFSAGQKLKHRIKSHGAKQKMSICADALRRDERRPNLKRLVAEALEDDGE